jgi:hypothetical protein
MREFRICQQRGEVAEWFKAAVLKTAVRESVPWVRIPPSPPIDPHLLLFITLKTMTTAIEALYALVSTGALFDWLLFLRKRKA